MWERSLDLIVAICLATLVYFLAELVEVVRTSAFWGAEAPQSTSIDCTTPKNGQKPGYFEETCIFRSPK